jgi:hypothetical protein
LEIEDYLIRQISQLGRVLGKILAGLLGLKANGQINSGIEAANQDLRNELGFDADALASMPFDSFIKKFPSAGKLNCDNFEILADILFIMPEELTESNLDIEKRKRLLERSLAILEYIENTSLVYSMERNVKIEKLKLAVKSI